MEPSSRTVQKRFLYVRMAHYNESGVNSALKQEYKTADLLVAVDLELEELGVGDVILVSADLLAGANGDPALVDGEDLELRVAVLENEELVLGDGLL